MNTCPRCRHHTDPTDCYCRYCGRALQPRIGFWFDNWGILLLTLIVGPFALFAVWFSRKISLTTKGLWTAFILLLSVYMCYALYRSFLLFKQVLLPIL